MSFVQNHEVRLLIVDPDPTSRNEIRDALAADGFKCDAAATADEAMALAMEAVPSLLIADVELGKESGLALYGRIRKFADIPAVFLSGSRDEAVISSARRAGGTYFLSKPIDTSVLLELVDKALWMPHLVRRHIDSAQHQLRAPSIAGSKSVTGSKSIRPSKSFRMDSV